MLAPLGQSYGFNDFALICFLIYKVDAVLSMHDRTPTIVYGELAMNGMMFMALSAPYKLKGLEIWNLGIHLLGSKHKARKGMMVWFGMGINSKPIIYNFKKNKPLELTFIA